LGAGAAHAPRGPLLVADGYLESNAAPFVSRRAPLPLAPTTLRETPRSPDVAPQVTSHRHARKAEPVRTAAAVAHAPATPQPDAPVEWIHAPIPERAARDSEPARPQVGLDEVLAATSVKPLMRLGPAGTRTAQPFSLVPQRTRTR
jgi:hypothetical protein